MRTVALLPLLIACGGPSMTFVVYDFEQECRDEHRGLPPGMPEGACDVEAPSRSVFWSDDGQCWIGTRCERPGQYEGYEYTVEGDPCMQVFATPPDWPWC